MNITNDKKTTYEDGEDEVEDEDDHLDLVCPPPWPEAKEKSFAEQMNFLWPSARGVGI